MSGEMHDLLNQKDNEIAHWKNMASNSEGMADEIERSVFMFNFRLNGAKN